MELSFVYRYSFSCDTKDYLNETNVVFEWHVVWNKQVCMHAKGQDPGMTRFKSKFHSEGKSKKEGFKKYKNTSRSVSKLIDEEDPENIALGIPCVKSIFHSNHSLAF